MGEVVEGSDKLILNGGNALCDDAMGAQLAIIWDLRIWPSWSRLGAAPKITCGMVLDNHFGVQ